MINERWLNDVMEVQGEALIEALQTAGQFTSLPVITSVRSPVPFNRYYSIVPKLTEIPLKERIEMAREDDPNDTYSVVMDLIYERRTCGDITDDEEEETLSNWATDSGVPKYRFNATIFTDREALNELPFTGSDFKALVLRIKESFLVGDGVVTFVTPKGVLGKYDIAGMK